MRLSILSFSSTFIIINAKRFLPDPGVSGVRSDVTLADDDTNSILADDANRAI